jgi:Gas vesicle synthesis protein GvpL/GvpF
MTGERVYVYGVVRSGHPLPAAARGVGALRVRRLRAGRLTAVVSEVPDGLRARRRDLMAHQGLLLELARGGPVLPMRFGMVSPDEQTVLGRLDADREEYLAALERLDGRCEMNVKALPAEHAVEPLVREDPQVRRLTEQARRHPGYEASVRLGEAVAAGLARRAAEAAGRALRELSALADGAVRGPEVPGCALNMSFLVAREQDDRFRAAVERFADGHRDRVELRLTGPLPCYSFVPADRTGA